MDDAGYIFAAFAVVWAILFGYVLMLGWSQKHLDAQVKWLEGEMRRLEEDK